MNFFLLPWVTLQKHRNIIIERIYDWEMRVSLSQLKESFVVFCFYLILTNFNCLFILKPQPIIHNAKNTELRKNSKLFFAFCWKSFCYVPYYTLYGTL